MHTTLNQIKSHLPCRDGLKELLKYLGKTKCDDEKLLLLTIYKSNGFDDAVWCLQTIKGNEIALRKLACLFAFSVKHLWDMPAIVEKHLLTQDEDIRDEAHTAAATAYDAYAVACAVAYARDARAARATAYASRAALDAIDAAAARAADAAAAGAGGEVVEKILVDFIKQSEVEGYINA